MDARQEIATCVLLIAEAAEELRKTSMDSPDFYEAADKIAKEQEKLYWCTQNMLMDDPRGSAAKAYESWIYKVNDIREIR